MLILITFQMVNRRLQPPEDPAAAAAKDGNAGAEAPNAADQPDSEANANGEKGQADDAEVNAAADLAAEGADAAQQAEVKPQWLALGSLNPQRPEKMLVWFNNRGATVECVALNEERYRDLDDHHGYLGYLALQDAHPGCQINVIGDGTPAQLAVMSAGAEQQGLLPGDVLLQIDDQKLQTTADLDIWLEKTKPGQSVRLVVERSKGETRETLTYTTTLTRRPLEVIRPERLQSKTASPDHPLSYRLTLQQLGTRRADQDEIEGLPSLWQRNWQGKQVDGSTVEFETVVQPVELKGIELQGPLRITKRFTLKPPGDETKPFEAGYHLNYEIIFKNESGEPIDLAYQQDGPTGLPLEGWWYTNKTHPTKFGGAGVRDLVSKTFTGGHKMFTNPNLIERLTKNPENVVTPMYATEQPELQYVGVDAQYFVSALVAPVAPTDKESFSKYKLASAMGVPIPPIDTERSSRTDVTFRVVSPVRSVPANGEIRENYLIFAGPKDPKVLSQYYLDEAITYGWFPLVAKPLQWVLHVFKAITSNYGIAIILLTVLVRGCLFPLGIQQVRNAQKMQDLAPEMKRLAELYKTDMEKRAAAQRELFRKHNYNPLAGCLPMFFQLPIFVGLYRALSVDIELRQAALIPGLQWCSNLAGPDQLMNWESFMPTFLASRTGWLGPYLNILPLISVALMVVHQRMFTPPPTDKEQEMQQRMMKFMMMFFGLMFFKVPAGLCIYFITSSLWGLAERKLLPRGKATPATTVSPAPSKSERRSKKK